MIGSTLRVLGIGASMGLLAALGGCEALNRVGSELEQTAHAASGATDESSPGATDSPSPAATPTSPRASPSTVSPAATPAATPAAKPPAPVLAITLAVRAHSIVVGGTVAAEAMFDWKATGSKAAVVRIQMKSTLSQQWTDILTGLAPADVASYSLPTYAKQSFWFRAITVDPAFPESETMSDIIRLD